MEPKQRIYAGSEFGAKKKMLNSFVLTEEKRDGNEEMWARNVLLLFQCSVEEKTGRV